MTNRQKSGRFKRNQCTWRILWAWSTSKSSKREKKQQQIFVEFDESKQEPSLKHSNNNKSKLMIKNGQPIRYNLTNPTANSKHSHAHNSILSFFKGFAMEMLVCIFQMSNKLYGFKQTHIISFLFFLSFALSVWCVLLCESQLQSVHRDPNAKKF